MELTDKLREAISEFAETFSQPLAPTVLAVHLSCHEVETVADLLRAVGQPAAANNWIEAHAPTDNCSDWHCRCGGDCCANADEPDQG